MGCAVTKAKKKKTRPQKSVSARGARGDEKWNRKLSGETWPRRESIANLSINRRANKSINMLTPAVVQTLDLFRGLSLGMGAWEGPDSRGCSGGGRERRDESQFGFYWQGQKLTAAPRETEIPLKVGGKMPVKLKMKRRNRLPDSNRYPSFCVRPPSHYIHWAVKYSHANGSDWAGRGDLYSPATKGIFTACREARRSR